MRAASARRIVLTCRVGSEGDAGGRLARLRAYLEGAPRGRTSISLEIAGSRAAGIVDLPDARFAVAASAEVLRALEGLSDGAPLRIHYDPPTKNGTPANGAPSGVASG